jgi:hypothetical protein
MNAYASSALLLVPLLLVRLLMPSSALAQELPRDVPHTFTLALALFGGITITTEARSKEACELARRATRKKLLTEAEGVVRYDLSRCIPKENP